MVQVLRDARPGPLEGLVVGAESLDDAAVVRWSPGSAPWLVQTVDFITPVCDDPYAFGGVAAANALSDVYAMGGTPRFALAIVAFPSDRAPLSMLERILAGGADKVREAGAAIIGGHSVRDPEPKYGLAVTGEVSERTLTTNAGARPGDALVLTKALGTGLLVGALRAGELPDAAREAMLASMLTLNAAAARCMADASASAATDVSGFGLLGHAMHVARASGVAVELDADALPALPGARALAAKASFGGAAGRNLAYVADSLGLRDRDPSLRLAIDPQTSGGLLVAVCAERASSLMDALGAAGVADAAIVGRCVEGEPGRLRLG